MWTNFERSTVEDETISNAYSSRGIFKIRSEAEVEQYPRVLASMQNQKMVLAIDKTMISLEDELAAKCSFLNFNADIDAIAISHSGNLIVVGLSDGEIHGIFIKGIPLFNVCIKVEDVHLSERTFISIQQLGQRFYFMCSNGSVYHLSEIDETVLETQLNISLGENETASFDESILDHVKIERFTGGRSLSGISAGILDNTMGSPLEPCYIAGSYNAIYCKSPTDDLAKIVLPERFEGVKSAYNLEDYILVLTNSGHLLEVCPITKLVSYDLRAQTVANYLIDEVIIIDCGQANIELLVLTKNVVDDERTIKIIEYPSFKCSSELDVPEHTWLVHQPKCSVNLYYISGQNLNVKNYPTEIEMILVSETHPSERFKKLIAKGHLEEAEEFGKQFDLCLQPIYEAKARRLLLLLSSIEDHDVELMEQYFGQLVAQLRIIGSREFFRSVRMTNMPTRSMLKRYLREIHQHLDEELDDFHIAEMFEQLFRLDTLNIIDPYECNLEWQKFVYHPNLVKMIITLFKSDLPTACIIWKRHSSVMIQRLDDAELRKLLTLIPNNTEAFNLVQWLRYFVPTVCITHPQIMPFVTEWSIQKTRALQYSRHWPEIGLEFATKVAEIFDEIEYIHSDVRRQHERNIAKLSDLVNALQDLSVLKKSYNLTITLDNYLQDSIDDTALCILQGAHLDSLKSLVNDFLYPIFQEKGKSPVTAIRHYVTLLVGNRNVLTRWLERAVACIELLHNEDDRLECALQVLQSSPVPWPETVTPLIKLRYSTHPLAQKINTEYEIQVIKIMKVKYQWPADSVADKNLELFMFRIVKMDLPEALQDIRTLTKAAPWISTSANFNCCYQMVRRGKPEMAYEFFKMLNDDKNSKATLEIIEIFADMLENAELPSDDKAVEEQRNLIDFYKLIVRYTTSVSSCHNTQKRLFAIQHRFTLQHKFHLKIKSIAELVSLDKRLRLLDAGIENIIERSQATVNVTKFIASEVGELSQALDVQKMHGIRRICQRMHCLPLSCALAYAMLEFADCTRENKDDFVDMALELIEQQIELARKKEAVTLGSDNDTLAFPLAYELLIRASQLETIKSREHTELLKYIRIVSNAYTLNAIEAYYNGKEQEINENICKALDAAEITIAETTLNYTASANASFDVKPTSLAKRQSISIFEQIDIPAEQPKKTNSNAEQISIVKFVARTLLLLVVEVVPSNSILFKLRQLLPEQILNDIDGARENFFLSLEQLIKAKVHDVWYIMAQNLLDYQLHNKCKIINGDFVSLQMQRVFRNIMSHKDVNFIDLFVMLIGDKHKKRLLQKLGTELRTDQQKVNLLTLTEIYSVHLEETAHVDAIRLKRIKHFYYMEFCKQDPAIKGKFNADIDDIEQLLKEFRNKQLDVHLLERMSRDFNLDYQQMLITQVISILRAQEMQYDIRTDSFGDEKLVMISTVDNIRSLCQPYLNEIKNTELLASKLKQFIGEINIYFYELYLCVIEILCFIGDIPKEMQVWTNILHFLKHKMVTRRCNRAGQLEIDMWLQSQSEIGVLPKIARCRLPFKPIVEQPLKDILESEVNVDNCESWFPLIQMHTALKGSTEVGKMRDYFCMSAVKNSISEYKAKNETETWHLQPTNNAFLKSILRLVQHVDTPSKAFLILYFVSSYAPDGADQVEASYECYKYALENEKLITETKCQEQLVKIKRKYPNLKTQHLLNIYGLTDESLMRLVENPTDLIYKLYHHDLILKASKLDINTVVKEIAELHNLDVEAIHFQLLQKWLSFTMDNADGTVFEETFFEDQNTADTSSEEASNAAENVIRANYILNSWPKKKAIQFLVAHIFTSDGSVNTTKQLQMYECFSKLNDGTDSFNNIISQRQYVAIKCMHDLRQIGYSCSMEKFEGCNKVDVLKAVWQRNSSNPRALEILASICLGYNIYLPKVWHGILSRMCTYNMIRELNALIDLLSCKQDLLRMPGFIEAWQCVLRHPLKNANQTRSFAQEEILHKTLFRLQGCPVANRLNLIEFANHYMTLQRPHMAAVLMAFCLKPEQRETIKKLVIKSKSSQLRKEILNLEDAGILPVILNYTLKELEL